MEIIPDLSVCVTAENGNLLRNFLASLYETAAPVAVETIVMENGTNPVLHDILAHEFPQVMLYETGPDASPVQAANHALRLAKGRYVSLWSDSLLLRPFCLKTLIDFMDDHPETGIVGPEIVSPNGEALLTARPFPGLLAWFFETTSQGAQFPLSPWSMAHRKSGQNLGLPIEIDWLSSLCLIIREEVIDEIGLFDKRFTGGYEAADFCRRAHDAGWHINYLPTGGADLQKPTKTGTLQKPTPRDIWLFLRKKWLGGKSKS